MQEMMVERVAKAIWNSLEGDTHTGGGWNIGTGRMNVSDEQKERFRKMTRAAIEAMREPTAAMCRNGAMCMPDHSPEADDAKRCWQDMIDAALADREG